VTLYYCDLRSKIEAILRGGFPDGDVWLSDTSLGDDPDSRLRKGVTELAIRAPDGELTAYEVIGTSQTGIGGPRAWRVPAKIVNRWPRWWAD
jgi:hypothetical protein